MGNEVDISGFDPNAWIYDVTGSKRPLADQTPDTWRETLVKHGSSWDLARKLVDPGMAPSFLTGDINAVGRPRQGNRPNLQRLTGYFDDAKKQEVYDLEDRMYRLGGAVPISLATNYDWDLVDKEGATAILQAVRQAVVTEEMRNEAQAAIEVRAAEIMNQSAAVNNLLSRREEGKGADRPRGADAEKGADAEITHPGASISYEEAFAQAQEEARAKWREQNVVSDKPGFHLGILSDAAQWWWEDSGDPQALAGIIDYWLEQLPVGVNKRNREKVEQWREEANSINPELYEQQYLDQWRVTTAEQFAEQSPQQYGEFLLAAGGDEAMAKYAVTQALEFYNPDLIAAVQEQGNQEAEEMILRLRDQDYGATKQVMDWLASFNRNVPMNMATAFSLFLAGDEDAELRDIMDLGWVVGKQTNLHKAIVEADYSPAKVFGIEGTGWGLLLDLGMGIAFDPTIWLFTPAGRSVSKLAMGGSARAIQATLATPAARYMRGSLYEMLRTGKVQALELMRGMSQWGQVRMRQIAAMGPREAALSAVGEARFGGLTISQTVKKGEKAFVATRSVGPGASDAKSILAEITGVAEPAIKSAGTPRGGWTPFKSTPEVTQTWNKTVPGLSDAKKTTPKTYVGRVHYNSAGKATGGVMWEINNFTGETRLIFAKRTFQTVGNTLSPREMRIGLSGALEDLIDAHPVFRTKDDVLEAISRGRATGPGVDDARYLREHEDEFVFHGTTISGPPVPKPQNADLWGFSGGISNKIDRVRRYTDVSIAPTVEARGVVYAWRKSDLPDEIRRLMGQADSPHDIERLITDVEDVGSMASEARLAGGHTYEVAGSLPEPAYILDDEAFTKLSHGVEGPWNEAGSKAIFRWLELEDPTWQGVYKQLDDIFEHEVKRMGWMPDQFDKHLFNLWSTNMLKKMIKSNKGTRWLEKSFQSRDARSTIPIYGPGAWDEHMNILGKMWSDPEDADMLWKAIEKLDQAYNKVDATVLELAGVAEAELRAASDELLFLREFVNKKTPFRPQVEGQLLKTGERSTDEMLVLLRAEAEINPAYRPLVKRLEMLISKNELDDAARRAAYKTAYKDARGRFEKAKGTIQSALRTGGRGDIQKFWEDTMKEWVLAKGLDKKFPGLVTKGKDEVLHFDFSVLTDSGMAEKAGVVKTERLRTHGPGVIPADMGDKVLFELRAAGIDIGEVVDLSFNELERLVYTAIYPFQQQSMVHLPVAPIDLVMAQSLSHRAYQRMIATRLGWYGRKFVNSAHNYWVLDKVLRPATGLTVTGDEMMRIFHQGGLEMYAKYALDKAAGLGDRLGHVAEKVWLRAGDNAIQRSIAERLASVSDAVPKIIRERQSFLESITGVGYTDMYPGDPGFLRAAQRYTGAFLNDKGVQVYLIEGPEAFRNWFLADPAAEYFRTAAGINWLDDGRAISKMGMTADEAESLMHNIVEGILLKKQPHMGRAREALIKAVKYNAEAPGSANLPRWYLRQMGSIRGATKATPGTTLLGRGVNRVGDAFFTHPQQYREGLIARSAREAEIARLEALYSSQGIRIVPDTTRAEIARVLGIPENPAYHGSSEIDNIMLRRGVVTRQYINQQAEVRAVDEINKTLYSWHSTSRVGKASRAVYPFGKPWAEMYGYWLKETFRRPYMKGTINGDNANIARRFLDGLWRGYSTKSGKTLWPGIGIVNPRPPAMISRFANTSFEVEDWDLDFGAALFFPTKGENPFYSLLPGIGVVPFIVADWFMPDALDKPSEFADFQNSTWAKLIPQLTYGTTGVFGRYFSGGNTSVVARAVAGFTAAVSGHYPSALADAFGDMTVGINALKVGKGMWADEKTRNLLIQGMEGDFGDFETFDALLYALSQEAYWQASTSETMRMGARQIAPVRIDLDPASDEIAEVWYEFGDITGLANDRDRQAWKQARTDTDRGEVVDGIRSRFYRLPQAQRDALAFQHPEIVAMMVSGWEWSQKARDTLPEASVPYQSLKGAGALDLFNSYTSKGFLEPMSLPVHLKLIIGTYYAIRERVAKQVFTEVAETHNRLYGLTGGDAWSTNWSHDFSKRMREQEGFLLEMYSPTAAILGWSGSVNGKQLEDMINGFLAEEAKSTAKMETLDTYATHWEGRSATLGAGKDFVRDIQGATGEDAVSRAPEFWKAQADELTLTKGTYGEASPEYQQGLVALKESYERLQVQYEDYNWKLIWKIFFESTWGELDWEPPLPPQDFSPSTPGRNAYRPYVEEITDGDTLEVKLDPEQPIPYKVRLIGMRAADFGHTDEETEQAQKDLEALVDAIMDAPAGSVWLVRDNRFGDVDMYGRELAWLWVNGKWFYNPEAFLPTDSKIRYREQRLPEGYEPKLWPQYEPPTEEQPEELS